MAQRVYPFLRLAVLCHGEPTPCEGSRVIEPLHTIRMAVADFGEPIDGIYLYAQLEDAAGPFEFSIRVEDENGIHVPQRNFGSVTYAFDGTAEERIIPYELRFRLAGLVLPGPGVYHFLVRADTSSLHQRESAARAPFLRALSE